VTATYKMVVSRAIKGVIDQNYSEIIKSVPLVDILYDLRGVQILSNEEVKKLRDDCKTDKERAFEFLTVLESRSDDNFYQFCCLLKESDICNVRKLGKRLEKEANKTAENKDNLTSQNQATSNQTKASKNNWMSSSSSNKQVKSTLPDDITPKQIEPVNTENRISSTSSTEPVKSTLSDNTTPMQTAPMNTGIIAYQTAIQATLS
ncbi:hypothetical protein TrispH2_012017, partial [Trichoplax sp. H2]